MFALLRKEQTRICTKGQAFSIRSNQNLLLLTSILTHFNSGQKTVYCTSVKSQLQASENWYGQLQFSDTLTRQITQSKS